MSSDQLRAKTIHKLPLSSKQQTLLSIGLMSGTSMDGIDAALIETDGLNQVKELGHCSLSYDPLFKVALKAAEFSVRKAKGNLQSAEQAFSQNFADYLSLELKQAHVEKTKEQVRQYLRGELSLAQIIQISTQLHAEAVKALLKKWQISAKDVDIVGYHGQALFHQPSEHISVIVGDGQLLANELQMPVINDFRSNDIAHGGQGAPFAPLYHLALCRRDQLIPVAVVNCGGIANITFIHDDDPTHLTAFDVGPGNGLIDRLVRQRTAGREHMDENGHYGQQGTTNQAVLSALLDKAIIKNGQNYFNLKPPKSLDIGDLKLIEAVENLKLEEACRTLEAFTAEAIVQSLDLISFTAPKQWILAGGGWNNPVILEELQQRLTKKLGMINLKTADQIGWNGQALEAQIFAYLAVRSLKQLPLSLPGTTGASKAVSGGHIYFMQN